MVLNFVYLNLSVKLLVVAAFKLAFYICISPIDPSTSKLCGEQEEIDASTDHWDLSLVLPVLASYQDRFRLRREPRLAGRTESRGGISSPFRVPNTKPVRYARRDTKVSQISDWRIASKIARRVNNRYVFASRGMSRGMSAFWMHPRVSHDDRRRKKKKKHFRRAAPRQKKQRKIERGIVLQRQFHSAKCKFFPLHYDRAIWSAVSKLIDGDAVIDTDPLVAYKDISEGYICDLSCFRLTMQPPQLWIYYDYYNYYSKKVKQGD